MTWKQYFCCVFFMLCGCSLDRGTLVGPDSIVTTSFDPYSIYTGIYPSSDIEYDINNPFDLLPGDMKWEIESNAGPIAAFYSWSMMLEEEPTGEHQYYVAKNLHTILSANLYIMDDLQFNDMVIRAYQSVLTHFPKSVSYQADGETFFYLCPLAVNAIQDLGGQADGYVVITNNAGTIVCVEAFRE